EKVHLATLVDPETQIRASVVQNLEQRPRATEIAELDFRERRQPPVRERRGFGKEDSPRGDVAEDVLALQLRDRLTAIDESARDGLADVVPVLNRRIGV